MRQSESASTYTVCMMAMAQPARHHASAKAGSRTSGIRKLSITRRATGRVSFERGSRTARKIQLAGTPAGSSNARRMPRMSRYTAERGAAWAEPWDAMSQPSPMETEMARRWGSLRNRARTANRWQARGNPAAREGQQQRDQPLFGRARSAFQHARKTSAIAARVRHRHQQEGRGGAFERAVRQARQHRSGAVLQALIEAQKPEGRQKAHRGTGRQFQVTEQRRSRETSEQQSDERQQHDAANPGANGPERLARQHGGQRPKHGEDRADGKETGQQDAGEMHAGEPQELGDAGLAGGADE